VKRFLVLLFGLAAAGLTVGAGVSLFNRNKVESTKSAPTIADDPDLQLVQAEQPQNPKQHISGRFRAYALPFLEHHCVPCHGLVKPKADITLAFADEAAAKASSLWGKVVQVIDAGQMPPPGRPKPQATELQSFRHWILFALSGEATGGVPLRRLNRAEYNNTVRDLLGTALTPADDFPADDSGEGFDNLAQVLSVSPTHIEAYLGAADALVENVRANPALWSKISRPPIQDFVPFVLRGAPPERADAIKGIQTAVESPDSRRRAQEIDRAYYALQAFADRAYRRPITHQEMFRLMRFVDQALSSGEPVDEGLARALKSVLVSPHFLLRMDLGGAERSRNNGWTDFELASRLSFFLWSTMPDEELLKLAAARKLADPAVLNAQVRRMLRDSRARALAKNFAGQWLQVRALSETTRDPGRYPEFDDELRSAMLQETHTFFDHVIRTDQSALDLLIADYTFINERLARHYGLSGVVGKEFRKVELADINRAGLLTHASVLTVTASPTRTSPTKRGKWILENMLGTPPMTPPPGVDTLANGGESKMTTRQRFELHRIQPECASCHTRMDALGYGLEQFGPSGAWRDRDDDGPIDATGVLPSGATFHGARELRAELARRPDEFVRCLTKKLMTYALGRPLTAADQPVVDAIVQHAARRDYQFSSLVIALVRSRPFQDFKHQAAEEP
jgi:hypothetical protein